MVVDKAESRDDSNLTATGDLTITDIDRTDIVTTSHSLVVSGTADSSDPAAPDQASLLQMFQLNAATILDATEVSDALTWNFDADGETFNYLATGETLILTYTVEVTDSSLTSSETVTIQITGTNDSPQISNGADSVSLTETNAVLSSGGDFSVEDFDTTNNVRANVSQVDVTGSFITDGGTLPSRLSDNNKQALLEMLNLTAAEVDADSASPDTINWNFSSNAIGADAFDFLAEGDTLRLNYTISLQDTSGDNSNDTSETSVLITITGSNDEPLISGGDDSTALQESDTTLNSSGEMSVSDADLLDTVAAAVQMVDIAGNFPGTLPSSLTDNDNQALLEMLKLSASGIQTEDFESGSGGWLHGKTETDSSGQWGTFLGRFATGEETSKSFSIDGSGSDVSFDFLRIDSWDNGGENGPEKLIIEANGETIVEQVFLMPGNQPVLAPVNGSSTTTSLK